VELFEAIRRDARVEEVSIRGLADRYGVHRRTVRQALGSAEPFASQCQEAFLEGHVHAFTVLGGVPVVHVRYDNLKAAVSRVLFGRSRVESARWVTFRSHYGFDAFYCSPGIDGAHEKGGVEGEGGRFRRTHLVPMPVVGSVAELNARLEAFDAADDHRRIGHRTATVGADFAVERQALAPLPGEVFETGVTLTPRVDRYSRVSVRQSHYSVPARLIGGRVRVLLRAGEVLAFDGPRLVARHERARSRGSQVLVLDHYLEVLARKPGALPGAAALAQARAAGVFTPAHEAFWAAARAARGDAAGTRALIEVLLPHRHLPAAAVVAGMAAATSLGAANPELVAVEARRAAGNHDTGHQAGQHHPGARVITLPTRPATAATAVDPDLPTGLPGAVRPPPSVAHYDQLLTRRTDSQPAGDKQAATRQDPSATAGSQGEAV
jgi:hypothetical protein